MRYSAYTALVLGTVTIGNVVAGPVNHGHARFHAKRDADVLGVEATAEEKRDDPPYVWKGIDFRTISITYSSGQTWGQPTPAPAPPAVSTPSAPVKAPTTTPSPKHDESTSQSPATILTSDDEKRLTSLGFTSCGTNARDSSGGTWIGTDGPYTMKMVNKADHDIIIACWGPQGSWVNAHVPTITISLPKGNSQTLSFADQQSGACAPIYPDTKLVNGQVSNTWIEFTFCDVGVVDISREVNMKGTPISVVGPQCTTDMDTCVFVCDSGDTCMTGYSLKNCAPGSQPGAQYGTSYGAPSGGCGGLGKSASLLATFS